MKDSATPTVFDLFVVGTPRVEEVMVCVQGFGKMVSRSDGYGSGGRQHTM